MIKTIASVIGLILLTEIAVVATLITFYIVRELVRRNRKEEQTDEAKND